MAKTNKRGPESQEQMTRFGRELDRWIASDPERYSLAGVARYLAKASGKHENTESRRLYRLRIGAVKKVPVEVAALVAEYFGASVENFINSEHTLAAGDPPYPAWQEFKESDVFADLADEDRQQIASIRPSGEPTVEFYRTLALAYKMGLKRGDAIASAHDIQDRTRNGGAKN